MIEQIENLGNDYYAHVVDFYQPGHIWQTAKPNKVTTTR